ncbi:hypothetical protein CYY_002927 [Polysphondylium violaceum]|uniref:Uncharacterized protein n=1 Tax=Polysphondylium violaceum TaxID=133409 RepID=A0A8J4PY12_9MYCE|nr:hypothetical protein CYY_002927 [Polysphondylium violaceum]
MIFKNLSTISNPLKEISSKTLVNQSSMPTNKSGVDLNACWYVQGIGGPVIWVNDNANPHVSYQSLPPKNVFYC